jgi:hypothetical protein
MNQTRIGKYLVIAAILGAFAMFAFGRVRNSSTPSVAIFESGEIVYSGKAPARFSGLDATETYLNVGSPMEQTIAQIKRDIPTAIERRRGEDRYLVVPQLRNGRVLIAEFPLQAITVRPGRLGRMGPRMMVGATTGDTWSHVLIEDFRQPSPLEAAFNWIGGKLGI